MTSVEAAPRLRAQQKAATRAALLAAARAILAESRAAGTTSRAVAARAGVSNGTFFVHFADTAELISALLDEHLAQALPRATRQIAADLPLVDALVQAARSLFASYDRDPDLSRIFLAHSLFRADPVGPAGTRVEEFRSWVHERIRAAAARDEIAVRDKDLLFDTFFALYFGLLVGGLRGQISRRRQTAILRATLEALVVAS